MSMQRWALLRLRGDGRTHAIALPATVGASVRDDVVLIGSPLTTRSIVLLERDAQLVALRTEDGTEITQGVLELYGITLCGLSNRGSASNVLARWFVREGQTSEKRNRWMRALHCVGMSNPVRYTIFGIAVVALVITGAIAAMTRQDSHAADRSDEIHRIEIGLKDSTLFGNVPQAPHHPRGLVVHFAGHKGLSEKVGRVGVRLWGLDSPGKIKILLNGKELYSSAREIACVSNGCNKEIPVPKGVFHDSLNELRVAHTLPHSPWAMMNLSIQTLSGMTAHEQARVSELFRTARDAFDNLALANVNLLRARHVIGQIEAMVADKVVEPKFSEDLNALKHKVDSSLQQLEESLWHDVSQRLRVHDIDGARARLEDMMKIFPDPASASGQAIRDELDRVRTLR